MARLHLASKYIGSRFGIQHKQFPRAALQAVARRRGKNKWDDKGSERHKGHEWHGRALSEKTRRVPLG